MNLRRRLHFTLLAVLSCDASSFSIEPGGRPRGQRTRPSEIENHHRERIRPATQLGVVAADPTAASLLADYAPAATSLFNNMKLPAAVVTAGMISLGFATSFPVLPEDTLSRTYSTKIRDRCDSLRRLHVVVALISVTSELIVVMWAAVQVNQLTERAYQPTSSVWALIERDADLAWSAVNSHFVLGIIGFVTMLALRAYVMLLAAEASSALMTAASTGTAAALCLMISIVNRGVEAGGGEGVGYGRTIVDLLVHYVILLSRCATDSESPGPLELSAIIFETTSIAFALQVLITGNDKMADEEECPVVDVGINGDIIDGDLLSEKEREKAEICLAMEKRDRDPSYAFEKEQRRKKRQADEDSSVNVI